MACHGYQVFRPNTLVCSRILRRTRWSVIDARGVKPARVRLLHRLNGHAANRRLLKRVVNDGTKARHRSRTALRVTTSVVEYAQAFEPLQRLLANRAQVTPRSCNQQRLALHESN